MSYHEDTYISIIYRSLIWDWYNTAGWSVYRAEVGYNRFPEVEEWGESGPLKLIKYLQGCYYSEAILNFYVCFLNVKHIYSFKSEVILFQFIIKYSTNPNLLKFTWAATSSRFHPLSPQPENRIKNRAAMAQVLRNIMFSALVWTFLNL